MAPTAFSIAFAEFARGLKPEKKRHGFVQHILQGKIITAEDVQADLQSLGDESAKRTSRRMIKPVFDAIADFDAVISTLVSADPMPSALVWGGLKVIVDCCRRYSNLYDKIDGHLKKLTWELKRLSQYEDLFQEFAEMQEILVYSYINILRFWTHVEDECSVSGFLQTAKALSKSLTSFHTKKLDDILGELAVSSDRIAKQVPIVQERRRQGEHDLAAQAWRELGFNLDTILRVQKAETEQRRRTEALQWIERDEVLNAKNDSHQNRRVAELEHNTGDWIFGNKKFLTWRQSDSGSNLIWLYGGPGVGKSFVCAHAVEQLRHDPLAVVAFHYFRFDEPDVLSLTIYRNIAIQLFHARYKDSGRYMLGDELSDSVSAIVQGPLNEASAKELIKVLVAELHSTFIFLDGIDEEHFSDVRWTTASHVLEFFVGLARPPDSTLKLWCSSQHRVQISNLVFPAAQIQLDENTNKKDIDTYLSSSLNKAFEGGSPGAKSRLLEPLKQQVGGNFLWAAMMLKHVTGSAGGLKSMEAMVREGLPFDFERYLTARIHNTEESRRQELSKILSCLVFAKRPLLLEELCEALQVAELGQGEDLEEEDMIMHKVIMKNCEFFVQFDDIRIGQQQKKVCTLWHASLQKFLLKNRNILSDDERYSISPTMFSRVCIQYLQQPKYNGLLTKVQGSFATVNDEDVAGHYLLSYCAKYWRLHMDDLQPSEELCKVVEEFVKSPSFFTCLQIQSLWVGRWFQFWYSSGHEDRGVHLVREFPSWFMEAYAPGRQFHVEYARAIGEWGYFLHEHSFIRGRHPGQIERCLWNTLGKANFLGKCRSSFKGFAFDSVSTDEGEGSPILVDRMNESGSELQLYKLYSYGETTDEPYIIYESWTLSRGRSPKLRKTQKLRCPATCLQQYRLGQQGDMSAKCLEPSSCGSLLRVGSHILVQGAETLDSVPSSEDDMMFIQEVAYHGEYYAVASRGPFRKDPTKEDPKDKGKAEKNDDIEHDADDESSVSVSGSDSSEASYSEDESIKEADLKVEGGDERPTKRDQTREQTPECETLDDWESDSLASNSARDSESEGSTSAQSDEIADELDVFDLEDSDDVDSNFEPEESGDELVDYDEDEEVDIRGYLSADSSHDKARSEAASSRGGTSSDGEGSQSSLFDEPYVPSKKNGDICEIRVFRPSTNGPPQRVFRYAQRCTSPLFDSPPVFHPTEPLLVWPVGDGEILFANFAGGTYFVPSVRTDYRSSCPISVQCRFSNCGRYLHIASLDGLVVQRNKKRVGVGEDNTSLVVRLHVSTYRLSQRKTCRSRPRLIHRMALDLTDFSTIRKLLVSRLPFTLTWREEWVCITQSQTRLTVYRVPLFGHVQQRARSEEAPKGIFVNKGDVYLPNSVELRKVYFFEEEAAAAKSSKSSTKKKGREGKEEYVARVIIGAYSPNSNTTEKPDVFEDIAGTVGRRQICPQGIHLTAAQLGGWQGVKLLDVVGEAGKDLKRAETWRGGQLLAKYEKFDTSEDCDIVPYLAY